jgi:glutaredoxin 3
VFSKSYCPYCKATKSLLSEQGAKAFIIELDQVGMYSNRTKRYISVRCDTDKFGQPTDDGAAIQDALEEITKQRSVPNIFINHKHIGGNSDLQAKKSELPSLLKEAGAV